MLPSALSLVTFHLSPHPAETSPPATSRCWASTISGLRQPQASRSLILSTWALAPPQGPAGPKPPLCPRHVQPRPDPGRWHRRTFIQPGSPLGLEAGGDRAGRLWGHEDMFLAQRPLESGHHGWYSRCLGPIQLLRLARTNSSPHCLGQDCLPLRASRPGSRSEPQSPKGGLGPWECCQC